MTPSSLPRELVLASAGTGKTYHLTSRVIGLLERGADPEQILASTFTRNAAGEILAGVLSRVARAALDGEEARGLATEALLEGGREGAFTPADARRLLEALAGRLHAFEVGTLDSFFVRTARIFWPELRLPPTWTIADDPTRERLRSEALQDVLEAGGRDELVELVRMLARGESTRRVHDRLVGEVEELQRLRRQVDPDADDPWSPFRGRDRPDDPGRARRELARRVAEAELPTTASGDPDGRWVGARETLVEELRRGDWEAVLDGGLGAGALDGAFTYYGKEPPAGLRACLDEVRELAAAELQARYDAQARAMGRLAERFDRAHRRRQRREGAYRFEDVTHRLGGDRGVVDRDDLGYRLNRGVAHLLLDEFQDTSLTQWETLEPLVDRVTARPADESAAVVVADPKQSIYGWRGADPKVLDRVEERYDLRRGHLDRSWRSSPVVLDFVDDLFDDLPSNPVLEAIDHGPEVARRWSADLTPHRPAPRLEGEPGHVRIEVGPEDELRRTAPPRMMARAADRVAELRARAPGAGVGVLTRTNEAVARLIGELRRRGIEASEEGGTPVSDAAPVAAVLSLLRLADHPGDRVARYHVARTPLGEVVEYTDHDDGPGARRLALAVRRRLARDGYGDTLAGWAGELASSVDAREQRRLRQLVELGFRWSDADSLRPGDFVRFVESERVEDPSASPVRVMTVHQAKGLEFDTVVLPELDTSLTGRGGAVALPERDPRTGRVLRVFPGMRKALRPLFPEMEAAHRQRQEAVLRDALSLLYVAVTRARRAVHVLVAENAVDPSSSAKRFSRLVLAAFGLDDAPGREGQVLLERGDPEWHRGPGRPPEATEGPAGAAAEPAAETEAERAAPAGAPGRDDRRPGPPTLRVDPSRSAGRMLRHRAASDLEPGGRIDLSGRLELGRDRARARGTLAHEWLRRIVWLEDGPGGPSDRELWEVARAETPGLSREAVEELAADLRGWLRGRELRDALSREAARGRLRRLLARRGVEAPEGALELRADTEWPFARRSGDRVVSGRVDRLVRVSVPDPVAGGDAGGGARRTAAAEVVDYKTDGAPDGGADDRHRAQLRAYRRAVAALAGLEVGAVVGRLVYLGPEGGRVVTPDDPGA